MNVYIYIYEPIFTYECIYFSFRIPLAAGLFNRDIYIEGIKRRAAAMDESQGTSKVCSIQ